MDCSIREKICKKVSLLTNDARVEWNGGMIIFFQGPRVAVGRPQGRESFHVLVSTEPRCVNTPAANDRHTAELMQAALCLPSAFCTIHVSI